MTFKTIWEYYHNQLCDLYRQMAKDHDEGYDRIELREAIDRAETIEDAAWAAYRKELV